MLFDLLMAIVNKLDCFICLLSVVLIGCLLKPLSLSNREETRAVVLLCFSPPSSTVTSGMWTNSYSVQSSELGLFKTRPRMVNGLTRSLMTAAAGRQAA